MNLYPNIPVSQFSQTKYPNIPILQIVIPISKFQWSISTHFRWYPNIPIWSTRALLIVMMNRISISLKYCVTFNERWQHFCWRSNLTFSQLIFIGPCTPQNWTFDIAKRQGILLFWNLDIWYYPLKMGCKDIGFTEMWILGHSYQFLPPLVRQVEVPTWQTMWIPEVIRELCLVGYKLF